jgi:hypothetical protein
MFSDSFHDTMEEALEEVARRRADSQGKELVTRVERSPYGGFRVRSMPAEYYVDLLADGPVPAGTGNNRRRWEETLV